MKRAKLFQNRNALVLITAIAFVLLASVTGQAQEVKKVGTSAAAFLKIPVGAKGTAMGGAFVAMADDPSAMYWNPGGLPRVKHYALMVDHSPWLPGLSLNFISALIPIQGFGTIGVSVTSLSTEEMDITTPSHPMGTGEKFDAASMVVSFAYGRALTERFTIGGSFKYVSERILNSSATGIAFDIGTVYDTPLRGLRLGFSVSNFGSKMRMQGEDLNLRVDVAPDQKGNNQSVVGQFKTDEFDLPLIMRLGLSYDAFVTENYRLTMGVDGVNPNDNAQSINVGAEVALYKEMFILRGGFNELFLENREKGLTLGAEFSTQKLINGTGVKIGYAFQNFEHLSNVNRFSFIVMF